MAVDINQPGGQGDSTEPEDIEMPMAPELKTASQKLTMDSFERIKVLGKGTFGSVYLVYLKSDVTRKRMAMKVVKKQKVRELEELDHMRNEREGKKKYKSKKRNFCVCLSTIENLALGKWHFFSPRIDGSPFLD